MSLLFSIAACVVCGIICLRPLIKEKNRHDLIVVGTLFLLVFAAIFLELFHVHIPSYVQEVGALFQKMGLSY